MIGRIIATLVASGMFWVAQVIYAPQATLISGQVAGRQFDNSDYSYLTSIYTMNFLSGVGGVLTAIWFIVLVVIWLGPMRRVIATLAIVGAAVALLQPQQAYAYFDKTDITEAYTILPNESAFWIPDVGANKNSQVQMDSESYLNENKVATKRYVIPHAKLSGTGGFLGFDSYVPTGRLIITDRTTFSREWVAQHDRGTSNKNESFPCQSKEGLNIAVGVSIGASVSEANAAKYLYHFGVLSPAGDRTDMKVIFTSVYYGRKLADVMDDVGRKKVQTLVCDQINARTFDKANEEAVQIMDNVKKTATDYFASVGITLDFIGWADTFTFDPDVQKAVNDKYASEKLRDALPVLQALANIKVQEGMGQGLATKGLPIVLTPDMINGVFAAIRPVIAPAPATAPVH